MLVPLEEIKWLNIQKLPFLSRAANKEVAVNTIGRWSGGEVGWGGGERLTMEPGRALQQRLPFPTVLCPKQGHFTGLSWAVMFPWEVL